METFLLKLTVAVIPLILLVASVSIISTLPNRHSYHPMVWHRQRRGSYAPWLMGSLLC